MEDEQQPPHVQQREVLLAEARRLSWAKDLSDEIINEISDVAELVRFQAGETIRTIEDGVTSVYFIVTGRVAVVVKDALDNVATREWLTRGRVLGLFTVGLTDHSMLQAEAVEPTSAFRLELSELLRLSRHAEFQMALMGIASDVIKRLYSVERTLPKPKVVGVIHQSNASRALTAKLVNRLHGLGESIAVAGDRESIACADVPYRQIIRDGNMIDLGERQELLQDWADKGRLLIEVGVEHGSDALMRLLSFADVVLWCVHPDDATASLQLLRPIIQHVPDWRDDIHVVWILNRNNSVPPFCAELREVSASDFKVSLEPAGPSQSILSSAGIERIVHHLRGIKIGLALGGGAARGMAHLGVLKALDDHDIHVDMIAGTSAGAMTGTIYAAGLSPEYATGRFKSDLTPSWIFNQLPGGGYWYLLAKYRFNGFESMLRKYLHDYRMQQLLVPMLTIAVDLVEGVPLLRDEGDATYNILESINLPPLALPLIKSQEAVVDGGLLNNVPADVLVENGCNFVIASTVTAKLERDFMGIRARERQSAGWLFPSVKVIMRQNLIQSHSMNAMGVEPADFVIAPDVTSFDLSEFTRADEMASVGESTAIGVISKLRKLLANLDAPLFGQE